MVRVGDGHECGQVQHGSAAFHRRLHPVGVADVSCDYFKRYYMLDILDVFASNQLSVNNNFG